MNRDLELILAFLETRAYPETTATPAALEHWLRERSLLAAGDSLDASDLRHAIHVRAALFGVIAERQGAGPDARTASTLKDAAARASFTATSTGDGVMTLAPAATGIDAALGQLLLAFYRLQETGELRKLKTCKGCAHPFIDVSRNQSRIWCEMATCGSVMKARAYRKRRADAHSHGP